MAFAKRNGGSHRPDWLLSNDGIFNKWQKRLFEMAKAQQEVQFADVKSVHTSHCGNVAVTVRISGAEADIHSGANAATVETVLRILKSC